MAGDNKIVGINASHVAKPFKAKTNYVENITLYHVVVTQLKKNICTTTG